VVYSEYIRETLTKKGELSSVKMTKAIISLGASLVPHLHRDIFPMNTDAFLTIISPDRMYAMSRAPFFHLLAESKAAFEAAYPPSKCNTQALISSNSSNLLLVSAIGISYYNKSTWSAWRTRPKRTLEDIIITPENRLKLKNQVEDFLKSKNWYANRGLSWKKGLLLYGPPGCGKTSTIIGLASNYNLNIHYLSLTQPGMNDETLGNAIRTVQQRSIVCLEVSRLLTKNPALISA
jgi:hypothetical protein